MEHSQFHKQFIRYDTSIYLPAHPQSKYFGDTYLVIYLFSGEANVVVGAWFSDLADDSNSGVSNPLNFLFEAEPNFFFWAVSNWTKQTQKSILRHTNSTTPTENNFDFSGPKCVAQEMAADTASLTTSTSHTLSATNPIMAPASAASSPAHSLLLENLRRENRHVFLQPTAALPTESLNIVKDTLEALAAQVSAQQQERPKESRKRKRGDIDADDVLKLRKVYVDGFETNQVWQQAKKIIGGVLGHAEVMLEELADEIVDEDEDEGEELSEDDEDDEDGFKEIDIEEEGEEELGEDEEAVDEVVELEDGEGEDMEEDVEEGEEEAEEDEEEEEDDASYTEDPNGLNDGFFSIDEFNRQTQWFEEQDARGDPYTDHVSDEEEIDWDADPNAPSTKKTKSKPEDDDAEVDDQDSDEDDGPTFGDMALNAPEGDSDDEMGELAEEDDVENNANGIYYKDFFMPPPKKSKGGDRPKKKVQFKPAEPTQEDVDRAMADVRRDLFDDESEVDDSEDALSDVSAGDPRSRRSAHERRQAKLAEEIRQLEAASVAKRSWTVSGEASAAARPVNSLLEEDLDFEYVGKPVPVITPEVSEDIESLIKRRILAQEFDEVIRRRPETESTPSNTRRGLVEVQDTKSNKGLAEIYEEEHVKNTNPDTYVSQSDEKLQKEEKEIENMWKEISGRLDSLSSWHYKPKPVAASLSVVADVGTVTMEDAQPATSQGVSGGSSRMAPQEIYKAGTTEAAAQGEVVSKSGIPLARQEMSREDKTRRRRRAKERIRKAGGTGGANGGTVSKKAQTIADLKKGGVKVINRKGEITDVDGNKVKAVKAASSGSYKL